MSDNQPPQPPPSTSNNTSSNTNTTTSPPSNANQNTNNPQNANTNPSLPSRLQSSATTLAQNLFTPSPADIAKNLQPGGSSNKAAPPSSAAVASAAQKFHGETAAPGGPSARGISGHGGVGDSFRSATESATGQDGLMEEAYQFENDQAFQDGGLQSGVSFYEQDATADMKGKGKGKAPEQEYKQDHQPFQNTWQSIATTHLEPQSAYQNAQDGSELLTLLTSPSFNPDFPEPITTTNLDSNSTLIPNDLSDPAPFPLSAQEIQTLESFRRNLGSHPTQGQQRINPTSLIPDIDNFLSTIPAQTQNDATALRDAVLTGLPGAEEWVAVEERYQDEVWGFLKPVLEEARREMEEKENGGDRGKGGEEDGPAVARLKMILRHMGA